MKSNTKIRYTHATGQKCYMITQTALNYTTTISSREKNQLIISNSNYIIMTFSKVCVFSLLFHILCGLMLLIDLQWFVVDLCIQAFNVLMWCKNEMEHASSTRRWEENKNNRNSKKLSSRFKTSKLNHIGVTDERVYYDVVLAKENGVNEENKKYERKIAVKE